MAQVDITAAPIEVTSSGVLGVDIDDVTIQLSDGVSVYTSQHLFANYIAATLELRGLDADVAVVVGSNVEASLTLGGMEVLAYTSSGKLTFTLGGMSVSCEFDSTGSRVAASLNLGVLNTSSNLLIGTLVDAELALGGLGLSSNIRHDKVFTTAMVFGGLEISSSISAGRVMAIATELGGLDISARLYSTDIAASLSFGGIEIQSFIDIEKATTSYKIVLMNMKTNAVSEYEGTTANSVAVVDDRLFIANSSGLFELTGNYDISGATQTNIAAELESGDIDIERLDFSKNTPHEAYTTPENDDTLNITVDVDSGDSYTYSVVKDRVKFGKGIKSRIIRLHIANRYGADFELQALRVKSQPFQLRRR